MAEESPPAASLRARVRTEMIEEIKQTARRHLTSGGAANLSLRAVARDMGMVSSAIYRYFSSRDELLTALIIDAYDSMGMAVERAEAALDRADLVGRVVVICRELRQWALANPHEYALTYGTPVPGYAAPQDTVGPATRVTTLLTRVLIDGASAGVLRPQPGDWLGPEVREEMRRVVEVAAPGVPHVVMARGMIVWTLLFGAVSFEVFGRLDGVIHNRDAWFDQQVHMMTRLLGLRP